MLNRKPENQPEVADLQPEEKSHESAPNMITSSDWEAGLKIAQLF